MIAILILIALYITLKIAQTEGMFASALILLLSTMIVVLFVRFSTLLIPVEHRNNNYLIHEIYAIEQQVVKEHRGKGRTVDVDKFMYMIKSGHDYRVLSINSDNVIIRFNNNIPPGLYANELKVPKPNLFNRIWFFPLTPESTLLHSYGKDRIIVFPNSAQPIKFNAW